MKRLAVLCGLAAMQLGCELQDHDETAIGKQWRVEPIPVLDVGAPRRGDEGLLGYAAGATRLSSGTIVVADQYAGTVRFYESSGKPLRTVGRRGPGPGEFASPSWLGQCSIDSVFVWDYMQKEMTVIDSGGRIAREYRFPEGVSVLSCSRDMVAAMSIPANMRAHLKGDSPHYRADVWLADSRGNITQRLRQVPALEQRPLGKITRLAVGRKYFYVGTAESASVDAYSFDGRRRAVVALEIPARKPTLRNYERAIDAQVAPLVERDYRETMKQLLLKVPMPEQLAPYSALFTDEEDNLWAVISARGDSLTWLRAIDADGRHVTDLRLPVDLTVFEIGYDYILGSYEDAQGAQHVAMYRFHRDQ